MSKTEKNKNSKSKKIKKNRRVDNQLSNYIWPDCVQPSGKTHWGEWKETNAKHIDVRSADYLNTRKKVKSKRSLLKLAYQEFIEANLEESGHIAQHENSWYKNNHGKLPKDTFHLIVSIQLQSIKIAIISYYVMRTDESVYGNENTQDDLVTEKENGATSPANENEADPMKSSSSTTSSSELKGNGNNQLNASNSSLNTEKLKLYNELMELQENENAEKEPENEKVKEKENESKSSPTSWSFMPKIHYGPLDANFTLPNDNKKANGNNNNSTDSIWKLFLSNNHSFICDRLKLIPHVVKSPWYLPIPNKPVLLGKYSPSRTYRGENYLEVDIEADSTKLAQKVVKGAHGVSKQIVVDIVWVIEGCKAAELPERCLGGVRLFNVDVTKVTPLKKWDDDAFTKNSTTDETEESESEAPAQESYEVEPDNKEILGVD